jgi:hypothetical protein
VKKLNANRALVAALLAVSVTVASAQLTRADVRGQLRAEQASGQLDVLLGEDSGSAYLASHFRSTGSRDEAKREVRQAAADGTLNALVRTDSGSFYLSRHQVLRTPRMEVKSELATAERSGTLDQMYGEDSGSFALSSTRPSAGSRPVFGWR